VLLLLLDVSGGLWLVVEAEAEACLDWDDESPVTPDGERSLDIIILFIICFMICWWFQ
jgi:hypothetical protein